MSKKILFEYAVLWHKTDEKGKVVETKIIIEPKTALSDTEKGLAFKVTREIPEEYAESADNIEIIIRPF